MLLATILLCMLYVCVKTLTINCRISLKFSKSCVKYPSVIKSKQNMRTLTRHINNPTTLIWPLIPSCMGTEGTYFVLSRLATFFAVTIWTLKFTKNLRRVALFGATWTAYNFVASCNFFGPNTKPAKSWFWGWGKIFCCEAQLNTCTCEWVCPSVRLKT